MWSHVLQYNGTMCVMTHLDTETAKLACDQFSRLAIIPKQTEVESVGEGLRMPANKDQWLRFPKVAGVQPRILYGEAVHRAWSFLAGS